MNVFYNSPEYQIVELEISALKPHPYNREIFDRELEPDELMVESVKEEGIIDMPVVSQDMFIVSGHRRIAAAKANGHKTIVCKVFKKNYEELTVKLLHANICKKPETPEAMVKAFGLLEKYKSLSITRFIPKNEAAPRKNEAQPKEILLLRQDLEKLDKEKKELEDKIKLQEKTIQLLRNEVEKHQTETISEFETKLTDLQEMLNKKQEEYNQLRTEHIQIQAKYSELQRQLEELKEKANHQSKNNVLSKKDKYYIAFIAKKDIVLESLKNISADNIPHTIKDEVKDFVSAVKHEIKRIEKEFEF